jgi:hypothetical protein
MDTAPLLTFDPSDRMMYDLFCELERRARGGHPFSLVHMRVYDVNHKQTILKAFREVTRVFDAAYEYDLDTDLLLSLKHCDTKGAFKFIDRLNHKLKDFGLYKNIFDACVVEPYPGDDMNTLLQNVKDDLNKIASTGLGEAGQYQDISPLKRFVDGLKG